MLSDPPTLAYYEAHAAEATSRYAAAVGGVSLWFDEAFPGSKRLGNDWGRQRLGTGNACR